MSIKIRVTQDRIGYLSLAPVSDRAAKRIAKSNMYDGESSVYLQREDDIEAFLKDLRPSSRRYINGGWTAIILMDEYDFRHRCGGQCD